MRKFYYFDKKRHGTPDFPVEYYYVDNSHPQYNMPFHWHNEWELLRVIKGEFFITLDDKRWHIKAGEIVIIPSETLHGGEAVDCVYECLVFDLYGLLGKIDAIKHKLRPFYNTEVMPEQFFTNKDEAVARVIDVFRNDGESYCIELETLSAISGLFSWLIKEKRYRKTQNKSLRSSEIKPVLEYIELHYAEELSLDTLAEIAGMNARYFCKVFYLATRDTPMNYVNQYRVERAAFLLESTNLSVTQIAADCGFWDSSYFTKVFKKFRGTTPKKYQRMLK